MARSAGPISPVSWAPRAASRWGRLRAAGDGTVGAVGRGWAGHGLLTSRSPSRAGAAARLQPSRRLSRAGRAGMAVHMAAHVGRLGGSVAHAALPCVPGAVPPEVDQQPQHGQQERNRLDRGGGPAAGGSLGLRCRGGVLVVAGSKGAWAEEGGRQLLWAWTPQAAPQHMGLAAPLLLSLPLSLLPLLLLLPPPPPTPAAD